MNHSQWKLLPAAPDESGITSLPPLIVQLLYNRGITSPTQFEPFIAADKELENDPFLLPDIHQAVARIYHALLSGENIAVYGDFDVDGITATAILVQGLSALGGEVTPYIPHRLKDGHGLHLAALEGLYQHGISLVITVDCGITATAEVKEARKMGLDIIITDHHTLLPTIPPAIAVVNPRRSLDYPFHELAGVGVAFKLLQALLYGRGEDKLLEEMTDLVALGTVADMVPLVGENRYLVKRGLETLNNTSRLGLQEIISGARLKSGKLDSESISWALGPRLNAAGRLGHAITSYKLLTTSSPEEAGLLAAELEQINTERQRLTADILGRAREKVLAMGTDSPLLMVAGEDYPAGILGIVAGKLADEFYRPVLVLELGEEMTMGSARSIPEFDLMAALWQCHDLLPRFGGHSRAAGFSLPTKNVDHLHQRLLELATAQLAGVDLRPHLVIDAEVPLSRLAGETFKTIQQLAPFGQGNPLPTFLTRNVKVADSRSVGSNGEHLSLRLKEDNLTWKGIGFNLGSYITEVTPLLDIVYNLTVDLWGEKETLQLNILDFAPAH